MAKIKAFEFIAPEQWRFTERAKVQLARQKAKEIAKKDFQFDNLEYQIDEYLRQWMLRELIETYHYPEKSVAVDELIKTAENSKIVGITVKNEKNEIVALISTGYFGESDLEFENACQKLQNDVDSVSTAFFGIVTDARRIAYLIKNDGESISDYHAVEDFPPFEQLCELASSSNFPQFKTATQKFHKLAAPKRPAQTKSSASAVKRAASNAPAPFVTTDANYLSQQPTKSRRSSASLIGFVVCLMVLILGGVWYAGAFDKTQPNPPVPSTAAETQQTSKPSADAKIKVDSDASKTANPARPVHGPTTYDDSPQQTASRPGKSSKTKTPGGVNPDGSIKLSNEDIAIMQTRPAANPNAQHNQSKVGSQSTAQSGTMPKKRQVVQTPY